ncbi:hypothetical protein KY360_02335 [Candidatus Woesearchaeota archaeon]|nr:hypothetical protein [Candidatus Woesearchaeota archaeon]
MGLFGKKKKPVGSGLDIPPAPPPVKATEGVVKAPAKIPEPSKPEFPTLPGIPPPEGLPTFEEGLKKGEKAPPVREAVKKEVVPIAVPPPPGVEMPPLPSKAAAPRHMKMEAPPPAVEIPPPPGMGAPPPPMKGVRPAHMEMPPLPQKAAAPPAMEIPPPPRRGMPKPRIPERLGMPPITEEAAPMPPSFEAVEEQISMEERAAMGPPKQGPIFIRADNYKDVLDELNVARNMVKESGVIFAGISDLSSISEQAYERWRLCLQDIERKLLYVDKSLFGKR